MTTTTTTKEEARALALVSHQAVHKAASDSETCEDGGY